MEIKSFFNRSIFLSTLLFSTLSAAGELKVFLRPDGNDNAGGLTSATAVRSLQVAINVALAKEGEHFERLRVIVAPGDYQGQQTVTVGPIDGTPLVIAPPDGVSGRPVFDGNNKGGTWFKLRNSAGKPTNVTISGLLIRNYVTAISLNGERESARTWNGYNTISGNVFENIGQIAFPSGAISTAAIRLVNSDYNKIVGNKFLNIRNVQGCSALHSIYVAHDSKNNLISENVFDGGCGAAVKVRDASNANVIAKNSFMNQESQAFLDSYCDGNEREDCTKKSAECPSEGNKFSWNKIYVLNKKKKYEYLKVLGNDNPIGCPGLHEGSVRVENVGNSVE